MEFLWRVLNEGACLDLLHGIRDCREILKSFERLETRGGASNDSYFWQLDCEWQELNLWKLYCELLLTRLRWSAEQ